ncbi:MAG: membrane associated rhomboid family serine protease [Sphingobacteriales bacterium]|jgi:membrane associated rhomboid family serine protease
MFKNTFLNDFKMMYNSPSKSLVVIILANVGLFVLANLIQTVFLLFDINQATYQAFVHILSLPAAAGNLITQPWTIFSYMFLHLSFFHILFNMLWLYWMGKILLDFLSSNKFIWIYILGGFAGGVLYMLLFNIFPGFSSNINTSYLLGASAGVLAIVVATATLLPDYSIQLMFFGTVKLKYLALVVVLLDLVSIGGGNSGGHIAHLGGALLGFVYIKQLRRGNDIGGAIGGFFQGINDYFKKQPKMKVAHKNKAYQGKAKSKVNEPDQAVIDKILDKISASGYGSLTEDEKKKLFRASEN